MRPSRGLQKLQKVRVVLRRRSDDATLSEFIRTCAAGLSRRRRSARSRCCSAPAIRCRTCRRATTPPRPTTFAVVRFNPQTRTRALDLLRWGLVPLWAKDSSFGAEMHQCARRDRRHHTGVPRRLRAPPLPDAGRRVLRMAEGEAGQKQGEAQPYALVPAEGGHLRLCRAVGALEEPGRRQRSCAASRSSPASRMRCAAPIHDRMPVILPPEAWPIWLGEERRSARRSCWRLLLPYPAELMRVYPIGPAVGNVRTTSPACLRSARLRRPPIPTRRSVSHVGEAACAGNRAHRRRSGRERRRRYCAAARHRPGTRHPASRRNGS